MILQAENLSLMLPLRLSLSPLVYKPKQEPKTQQPGASAGPATGEQMKSTCHNGMAVFIHTKGGLMYEAAIGGQKFKFTPK